MQQENEIVGNYLELTSVKENEVGAKFWQIYLHYPTYKQKPKKLLAVFYDYEIAVDIMCVINKHYNPLKRAEISNATNTI